MSNVFRQLQNLGQYRCVKRTVYHRASVFGSELLATEVVLDVAYRFESRFKWLTARGDIDTGIYLVLAEFTNCIGYDFVSFVPRDQDFTSAM